MRPLFALATCLVVSLFACTETSESAGGASAGDVSRCKGGCDKMKFFQCSSAAEQARCYDDCNTASASQIEVFVGCAESSVCDPACRTKVTPAGQKPEGASSATCQTACAKLVSCSFIKVGDRAACEAECQKSAYQFQIDCVNGNTCGDIPKACGSLESGGEGGGGGGGGGIGTGDASAPDLGLMQCQSSCDNLHFFECIDAAALASCRTKCTTAKASRDTFVACVRTAGPDCKRATPCLDGL